MSNLQAEPLPITGAYLIKPNVFEDPRGSFQELYHAEKYASLDIPILVQYNKSVSGKGCLRGLHYQQAPAAQGKLVQIMKGSVQDVIVDLRKDSPSFARSFSIGLFADGKQVWIPPGCAHGFLAFEDDTTCYYGCSSFYDPKLEGGIRWDDEALGIAWKNLLPRVSEKDGKLGTLAEALKTCSFSMRTK